MSNFSMRVMEVSLVGNGILLMHNPQLANPLNFIAKQKSAISGKRKKTEEDYIQLTRLEMAGSLYWNDKLGVYVPDRWIEGTILKAANRRKLGTLVKSGITVVETKIPLNYQNKENISNMEDIVDNPYFKFTTSVVIQKNRIFTSRPQFQDWSLTCNIQYDSEQLNRDTIIELLQTAGVVCGIGDWRPKFGKFFLASVDGQNMLSEAA